MKLKENPYVMAVAELIAVFGTFALVWIPQTFSIGTMTQAGVVATLIGCVIYHPVLLLVEMAFLFAAHRAKSPASRSRILVFLILANALLMYAALRTTVATVGSLASTSSMFTPRPEDLDLFDWATLLVLFAVPQALGMGVALIALLRSRAVGRWDTTAGSIG